MNTLGFLKSNEHKSENGFVSKAQYLKDNWSWLKYSYAISIRVRRRMKELGITQKELAQKLECTQQHVSVLLGGRANMTLETMSKLEQALQFDLIGQNLLEFSYPTSSDKVSGYLNDSAISGPIPEGFKTSDVVDGYKPRMKKGPKKKDYKK